MSWTHTENRVTIVTLKARIHDRILPLKKGKLRKNKHMRRESKETGQSQPEIKRL